jgi:hypothetical protein
MKNKERERTRSEPQEQNPNRVTKGAKETNCTQFHKRRTCNLCLDLLSQSQSTKPYPDKIQHMNSFFKLFNGSALYCSWTKDSWDVIQQCTMFRAWGVGGIPKLRAPNICNKYQQISNCVNPCYLSKVVRTGLPWIRAYLNYSIVYLHMFGSQVCRKPNKITNFHK